MSKECIHFFGPLCICPCMCLVYCSHVAVSSVHFIISCVRAAALSWRNSVLAIKDRSTEAVNFTLLKVKVKFFLEQATKTQRGS